jgi:hypothetical protein
MEKDEFFDALSEYVVRGFESSSQLFSPFLYATFDGAEAVDSKLSKLKLADGSLIRACPRIKSVSGLVVGDTVLCANAGPDKPVTILGIIEGDIRLYEVN